MRMVHDYFNKTPPHPLPCAPLRCAFLGAGDIRRTHEVHQKPAPANAANNDGCALLSLAREVGDKLGGRLLAEEVVHLVLGELQLG